MAENQFGGDACVGFFEVAFNEGALPLETGASVLEIGCAEFDWLTAFQAVRPDVTVMGIDWRRVDHPAAIQGDVLTHDFQPRSFDAIVSISAIEHIGLGAYDHDPLDPDGDTHAIQRAWEWLKPGGWLYFDVPYRPTGPYTVDGNFRAYDPPAFATRFALRGAEETWRHLFETPTLGDSPYLAVVWRKRTES